MGHNLAHNSTAFQTFPSIRSQFEKFLWILLSGKVTIKEVRLYVYLENILVKKYGQTQMKSTHFLTHDYSQFYHLVPDLVYFL